MFLPIKAQNVLKATKKNPGRAPERRRRRPQFTSQEGPRTFFSDQEILVGNRKLRKLDMRHFCIIRRRRRRVQGNPERPREEARKGPKNASTHAEIKVFTTGTWRLNFRIFRGTGEAQERPQTCAERLAEPRGSLERGLSRGTSFGGSGIRFSHSKIAVFFKGFARPMFGCFH